jgi:hypothetical protein
MHERQVKHTSTETCRAAHDLLYKIYIFEKKQGVMYSYVYGSLLVIIQDMYGELY